MEPEDGQVSGGLKLLWQGGRVYTEHAKTYLILMTLAVIAILLGALLLFFMIAPSFPGENLREIWVGMDTLQKFCVTAMFFASVAVFYRALAASMLATSEFSEGREIGAIQAFRRAGWKHTRLFWLMTAAAIFGPFAPLVILIAGFFFAPAFPASVVEDLGAFRALKRGQQLGSGNQLRIFTIYLTYLVAVTAAGLGIFRVFIFVEDLLGRAWYTKPAPAIGYLVFFTVVQWYMIVLTLNYLEQRRKVAERQAPAESPQAPAI